MNLSGKLMMEAVEVLPMASIITATNGRNEGNGTNAGRKFGNLMELFPISCLFFLFFVFHVGASTPLHPLPPRSTPFHPLPSHHRPPFELNILGTIQQ